MKFGAVRIEDTELEMKSRDDIPALLPALKFLNSEDAFAARLFALPGGHMIPGVNTKTGRSGMEMWRIPVMGVGRQGLAATSTGCTNSRNPTRQTPVLRNPQYVILFPFPIFGLAWRHRGYTRQNVAAFRHAHRRVRARIRSGWPEGAP